MSDVLTNLLARNQGTLPVIQPRLPSVYEPYRQRSGLLGMQTGMEPGLAEDVASEALVPPPPPGVEPPALPAPPQMRAAPPRLTEVESAEHRESARTLEVPTGARHLVAPARQAAPEMAHRSVTEISRTEMIPSVAQPVNREPIAPAGPVRTNGHSHPLRVPDAANRSDPQQPLAVRSHRVAGPLPVGRPEGPHRPSAQARPDMEEPAVHVTIGRVDVRAILPTPPVSRTVAAKFQPHLSLDEYLKQRDRGQR
jgi:hypothetical protein